MNYMDYETKYFDFEAAINRTRMISLAAGESLKDFPSKLPGDIRSIFRKDWSRILEILSEHFEGALGPQFKKPDSPFVFPLIALLHCEYKRNKENPKFDLLNFDTNLFAQELVMLYAHLDAFMAETMRTICLAQPAVLKNEKKFSWNKIIECGNWDSLFDTIVEHYVYEFGYMSIRERIQFLKEKHGLELLLITKRLDEIVMAENLRHIIIHNGGVVSNAFIEKTGRVDVKIGEMIHVTNNDVEKISDNIRDLGGRIFSSTTKKYFEIEKTPLFSAMDEEEVEKIKKLIGKQD